MSIVCTVVSWTRSCSEVCAASRWDYGPHTNDLKVFDYLMQVLGKSESTRLTYADISRGAKVPVGSIGIAIRRLVRAELVCKSNRGHFRLSNH